MATETIPDATTSVSNDTARPTTNFLNTNHSPRFFRGYIIFAGITERPGTLARIFRAAQRPTTPLDAPTRLDDNNPKPILRGDRYMATTTDDHGERLARLEATIEHLATKADLRAMEARLLLALITVVGIGVAILMFWAV